MRFQKLYVCACDKYVMMNRAPKNKYRNCIPVNFSNITQDELDWLIGFYIADGTKIKEKQRQYRVYFYLNPNKDELISKKMLRILKLLKLKSFIKVQEKLRTLFIRITSKEFFEIFPSSKKIQMYFPKNIDAFIAGFLDGDGYIDKRGGYIAFTQTIAQWVGPFISKYLRENGIIPWKEKYYRNAFYYRASLKKVKERTNIIRFMTKADENTTLEKSVKV